LKQETTRPTPSRRPAFRLAWQTPLDWVARVAEDPLALLSDHAHCELKAAASAQGLIARNPGRGEMLERLAGVAVEEMQHFSLVLRELFARGGTLRHIEPNPYTETLLRRSKETREHLLVDRLLVCGLIEARSLERFHLLAEHLEDDGLATLYRDLVPSEAAHQGLFLALAREVAPREVVAARYDSLIEIEAEVMRGLAFCVRMHSGMGDR
jgi:tRNA-(ms[2]io[6]A)-hydroxylase